MSQRTILLATVAVVCIGATSDAVAVPNWYVGLEGGGNVVQDWKYVPFGTAAGHIVGIDRPFNDTKFDTGWAVLASVGHEFGDHIRTELEVGYRKTDVSKVVFGPGSSNLQPNAALSELTVMANALYDCHLTQSISLSVGVGLGAADVKFETGAGGPAGWADHVEATNWSFAYQGIVGANYSITPEAEVFVDYRYLRVEGQNQQYHFPQHNSLWHADDEVNHTVTVGLRYNFSLMD